MEISLKVIIQMLILIFLKCVYFSVISMQSVRLLGFLIKEGVSSFFLKLIVSLWYPLVAYNTAWPKKVASLLLGCLSSIWFGQISKWSFKRSRSSRIFSRPQFLCFVKLFTAEKNPSWRFQKISFQPLSEMLRYSSCLFKAPSFQNPLSL